VEEKMILSKGGIYLAKLNPTKDFEIGKVRPVIVLGSQAILDAEPPVVFICPLSSKSHSDFASIHYPLGPRDNLEVSSFALLEHCRSIAISRIINPRLAAITLKEYKELLEGLLLMLG